MLGGHSESWKKYVVYAVATGAGAFTVRVKTEREVLVLRLASVWAVSREKLTVDLRAGRCDDGKSSRSQDSPQQSLGSEA